MGKENTSPAFVLPIHPYAFNFPFSKYPPGPPPFTSLNFYDAFSHPKLDGLESLSVENLESLAVKDLYQLAPKVKEPPLPSPPSSVTGSSLSCETATSESDSMSDCCSDTIDEMAGSHTTSHAATPQPDGEAKGSLPRAGGGRGRGGWRGRGRGRGGGNGRGRPRGRRNGADEPEPPRKTSLTAEEEERVRKLEQRQQELKKRFNTIAAQQIDLLQHLGSRDLNTLAKKARAHTKVPEFQELKADLESAAEQQRERVRKWYRIAMEAEIKKFEQEKEVVESQFRRRCEDTRLEHLQGLQGDIISLKKAHATALDETHTETGSEVDYFPHYHEFPEADARVRGYTSNKITDEKPFKQYLESHGDLDLQEVINEDITGPMIESLAREKAKHAQEQTSQKTKTLEALCKVAEEQLSEPGKEAEPGQQHPTVVAPATAATAVVAATAPTAPMAPMAPAAAPPPVDTRALSLLVDIAIWKEKEVAQQRYPFPPAGPNHHQLYPGTSMMPTTAPGPIHNGRPLAPAPTPMLTQPIRVTTVSTKRSRNRHAAFIPTAEHNGGRSAKQRLASSRSSRTRGRAAGRAAGRTTADARSTIVVIVILGNRPPNGGNGSPGAVLGGTTGKIPVTFVNQTIESRKAAARAAAKVKADRKQQAGKTMG
ncbi:hypothetical protein DV738_g171, partial [Chaetothyriales sp. CBS 135597]